MLRSAILLIAIHAGLSAAPAFGAQVEWASHRPEQVRTVSSSIPQDQTTESIIEQGNEVGEFFETPPAEHSGGEPIALDAPGSFAEDVFAQPGCANCPPASFGLTYIVGSVPNELFNVGAGAVLGRDVGTLSVLPTNAAPGRATVWVPIPGDGGPLGATRITDNNSAVPRNRIFLDYSAFNDIRATRTYDSHRATFGLERRVVDPVYGIASSLEVRIPFGLTLNPNATFGQTSDSDSSELGNILIGAKTQLYGTQTSAFSVGLAFSVPSADDFTIREANQSPVALFQNDSVHVIPYLAASWMPDPYTFAHIFYSIDVDATGGPVSIDTDLNGVFDSQQRLHSTSMQRLDISYGRWLFRDDCTCGGFSGFAWFMEYHLAASIDDPDSIVLPNNISVGNSANSINISNGAIGAHFKMGRDKVITFGYAAPLQDSSSIYKGEYRLIFNKYF